MTHYFRIPNFKPFGTKFYLHWSVLVGVVICVLLNLKQPLLMLISVLAYLSILLVHESGHALVARYLGYPVLSVRISFIHGTCTYGGDLWSEWHEVSIAWGGVAAQFAVALVVLLLSLIPGAASVPGLGPVFAFLGPISIFIAIYNLIPVAPLDGATAWRIVPLMYEHLRSGRGKKKQKRSPFRIVK